MFLLVAAILLGLVVGYLLGGRLRRLSETMFRWWPLATVGLVLQYLPVPGGIAWISTGLFVLSYVALFSFLAVNIRHAGIPLLTVGIALNVVVIAVNGGMPVSDEALRTAYGPGYPDIRRELVEEGAPKHHLADPDEDVLLPLADVIPIGAPVRTVFSAGDLVAMVAVVWVLAAGMRGGGGGRVPAELGSAPGRVTPASGEA